MRALLRGVGELLMTLGVVLLLFCVYQLYWTTARAESAMTAQTDRLHQDWKRTGSGRITPGAGFAVLYVPRLGADYAKPVIQGVGADVLARGIGHYPESALPGQVGNFALAGHRLTHGEPFRHLDRLRAGDLLVVETATGWYTYRLTGNPYVVSPSAVSVVAPVPGRPTARPKRRTLTLTTCHPWYSSRQRMVVHGVLDSWRARADGPPASLGPVTALDVLTGKG